MVVRRVPGLGEVTGFDRPAFPHVEQYRGIRYGTIPARFRQSKPVTSWTDDKWDATKYGPLAPFPRMVIGMVLTQKSLSLEHSYETDEFQCLNLNISCPKGLAPAEGFPVAVWVHGGGNVLGSGAEPGYDMAALVEYSIEIGMPTVMVTINYRLGVFGFLASDEIREDNEAVGDKGVGNYGLRDQLLAFEWVQKNISAFGGDPSRITAIGQSAGSIDTHLNACSQLFASQKPFHQAILQSGVAPLTVRGMAHQNHVYAKVTSHLKIERSKSAKEQIQHFRDLSVDELLGCYQALGSPVPSWQATVDGYYLQSLPTYSALPKQAYDCSLKRLLIGDCAEEGLIFAYQITRMSWTGERLFALATELLGETKAQELFHLYGMKMDAFAEELFPSLIRLATDVEWSQPIEAVAHSFSNGEVFYYHMTETNPFPGPNVGRAHHGVDLIFPFLTYQEHLSAEQQNLARTMARHWILFVNGAEPWKPYSESSGNIMHYGNGGDAVEMSESSKRAWEALRIIEGLQDKVSALTAAIKGDDVIMD